MNLLDALGRVPRVRLLDGATPIQRLTRIEEALGDALGGVRLYAKRDDVMSLGGGGNKLRKLEFLLGDAMSNGADTLVAVGGIQSNYARLAAAAAARHGLVCELVLAAMVPRGGDEYDRNGNVLLDDLFGATVHTLPAGSDPLAFARARADALRTEGRVPYVTQSGGSSPIGCLGYAACMLEIDEQARELDLSFAEIVVPNGSAGTQAGLLAALAASGRAPTLVRAHTVLAAADEARRATLEKANAVLELLGSDRRVAPEEIDITGDHLGDGYGIPTREMIDAVRLMATREGLLLDPVYSGKAFAGLLADVRAGRYRAGDAVLFIMTGGTPGLYAYASTFLGEP